MKKRIVSALIAGMMAVSLFAGCGNSSDSQDTAAATNEATGDTAGAATEESGEKVFTAAISYMPSSLQPSTSSDDQVSVTRPIYEPLFAETKDGFEYYLAESLDISDDGLTYTIHLQPDAVWSDGEPITVSDILFAMDYAGLNYGGSSSYNTINGQAVTMNEIDDKTLEIVLPQVYSAYSMTLARMYPLPAHAFDNDPSKVADSGYFTTTDMATSGAFTVSEINDDSIVYVARDDYYRGTPQIDKVVMKTTGTGSSKQLAFENGEIDYMRITTAEDLEKYSSDTDNYNVYIVSEARLNYLQLNPNGETMSTLSEDARKALFLALNPQEIIDIAYGSDQLATTANSLFTPDQSIYNADNEGYTYDLEEAKKLAESSGLSGLTLNYIYNADRSNMEAVATVIQQQAAAIGVTINVQGLDSTTFFATFFTSADDEAAPTWDLGTNGWDSERGAHAGQALSYFNSRFCDTGFSDELAALATQANATADETERQELWNQVQEQTLAEYWEYPLTYTNYIMVSHKNVTGLDSSSVVPEFIDYLGINVE